MSNIVDFPERTQVIQCGACDSISFMICADGIIQCAECAGTIPFIANRFPPWLEEGVTPKEH